VVASPPWHIVVGRPLLVTEPQPAELDPAQLRSENERQGFSERTAGVVSLWAGLVRKL